MKVGLILPMATSDPGRLLTFARRAEELGFDGLFAFDHLFPPGAPADRPSLEAYTALAAVSSVTRRVTIGTLVTRASLRPAGVIAKQAVALDDLSGGRFVLGLGTGDAVSRAEHRAFGLPYLGPAVRREHLVETVRAVRALCRGEPWGGGAHVPAVSGPLLPPPARPGGPPVWIGGPSEGAAVAAAREADGWNGWGLPLGTFERRAALVRREAEANGRAVEATWGGAMVVGEDPAQAGRLLQGRAERGIAADVWAGDVDGAASWLGALGNAGAAWAIVLPAGAPDRLELIGERVLPQVPRGAGVPSHRLKRAKRRLRREVLARRDSLTAGERAWRSAAVVDRVMSLPEMREARAVMAFWSFGSEVDTAPLLERLRAAGIRIALPKIHEGEVEPVAFERGDRVAPTSFGAMEPTATEPVDPERIDVVVTPGVGFDRRGNRVGYGGGYYDRLLSRLRPGAARIAVAFDLQVVEEVPAGQADRRVDAIVTEREVIRCRTA